MKLSEAAEIEERCTGSNPTCRGCPLKKKITLLEWDESILVQGSLCSFIQRLGDECAEITVKRRAAK
jgi:hypothetical protein